MNLGPVLEACLNSCAPPGLTRVRRPAAWTAAQINTALSTAPLQPILTVARNDQLRALVLCWHDCWDEAHELAQMQEGDPDMDLIHAVLHRRESDLANATYWLTRVVQHPAFADLPSVATAVRLTGLVDARGRWRAREFAERCCAATAADAPALIQVQAAELRALAHHLVITP